MKSDKKKELKAKTGEELNALATALKEKLEHLRFDLKSGKTAALKDIHAIKKEIAVVLTLLNQYERTTSNK